MKNIVDDLNSGKKVIVLAYDIDKLKSMDFRGKKIKIYNSLKRMYSFKADITLIKIHQNNNELNEIEVKILLILFKSALRQKVDYVYMPKMLNINDQQFEEYKKFIKYTGK